MSLEGKIVCPKCKNRIKIVLDINNIKSEEISGVEKLNDIYENPSKYHPEEAQKIVDEVFKEVSIQMVKNYADNN